MKKLSLIFVLSCYFYFTIGVQADAEAAEHYVALGDSLAAGQNPYSQIDAGYTDFIAMQLMQSGKLADFTKELTFPGYTVANVLASTQSERADELLSAATLVTISAGANDLLRLIGHNPSAGTLTFAQLSADYALNTARKDFMTLLDVVRTKAPNADIYVMGYYFPYPNVHAAQKVGTSEQLHLLNEILQHISNDAGAKFVAVDEIFTANAVDYLPNVADVHPNQQGYRIMANAMLREYSGNDALAMSENAMPAPNPLSFEEILAGQLPETSVETGEKVEDKIAISNSLSIDHYIVYFGYNKWPLVS